MQGDNTSVPGEIIYTGIPYAAPPVGPLRWMPPQPAAKFVGVFGATDFGPPCVQPNFAFGSEDCLNLNIYVPNGQNQDQPYPVMVWIHGGGLVTGANQFYDPTPLVLSGNVIVVAINYRLGILGFFAHPAIDSEGHLNGNYGLMDQQFALKWVRRNIGAFGGDPKRVTIWGESAGGESVLSNVASPTAAGLFKGGIVESGGYAHFQDYYESPALTGTFVPLATGETVGTAFVPSGIAIAADVGCGSQTATCLRGVPAADFANNVPLPFATVFPFVDGTVLTQNLATAFSNGNFNRVPIVSGTNHDEGRFNVAEDYDLVGNPLTDPNYAAAVAVAFGLPVTDSFVQFLVNTEYPLSNYPPPAGYVERAPLALGAIFTDDVFVCRCC